MKKTFLMALITVGILASSAYADETFTYINNGVTTLYTCPNGCIVEGFGTGSITVTDMLGAKVVKEIEEIEKRIAQNNLVKQIIT